MEEESDVPFLKKFVLQGLLVDIYDIGDMAKSRYYLAQGEMAIPCWPTFVCAGRKCVLERPPCGSLPPLADARLKK